MVDSHAASSQGLKALKASLLAKKQQLIEVKTFFIPACKHGGGGNVDNTGGGGEWWNGGGMLITVVVVETRFTAG